MPIYGGFWIRLVAYIIDAILLAMVGGIVGAVLGAGSAFSAASDPQAASRMFTGVQLASTVVNIVIGWLYYALLESSANRGTVGKMALGLVVTDLEGNQISFLRATGRYLAKILSGLVLLIGYIMIGFTERKQGLHDMIVGTVVTKKGTLSGGDTAHIFN